MFLHPFPPFVFHLWVWFQRKHLLLTNKKTLITYLPLLKQVSTYDLQETEVDKEAMAFENSDTIRQLKNKIVSLRAQLKQRNRIEARKTQK